MFQFGVRISWVNLSQFDPRDYKLVCDSGEFELDDSE